MDRPICLITGGNAGIGLAAAVQLARAGARVVIGVRNPVQGEVALEAIRHQSASAAVSLLIMDLSSRRSILQACAAFRDEGHRRLDVLIHNAADPGLSRKGPVYSEDGVETLWATNHLGPVLLTQQLEPDLARSAQGRVITVASRGLMFQPFLRVHLADPEFREGGFRVRRAYYQSKLAQVMYTHWLAEHLRGTRITAHCVRVAPVKVDLDRYPGLSGLQRRLYRVRNLFAIHAVEMAAVYRWLALDPAVADLSGRCFDERRRPVQPPRYARDVGNIRRLMERTGHYVPGLLGPDG
jgi:NAD(P)-dependent dehydrogenase (short-subunit alcohol dehydrogenase family)